MKSPLKLINLSTQQFLAVSSEQFVWEEWQFTSNSQLHNYYTLSGFSLYFHYLFFQTRKGLRFDFDAVTSVPILSFLP